jgi:hypothetical protein
MFFSQVRLWLAISCTIATMQSCKNSSDIKQEIVVIESVEQAKQAIEQYQGKAVDFVLPVSQDKNLTLGGEVIPRDAAMAVITDQILAKGWLPAGFEVKGQVRYYKYSQ